MMRVGLAFLVLSLALACEKSDSSPTPPSTTAPQTETPSTPPAVDTAAALEVPTPSDFEDEAEQQITAQNLEAELDKLEKEIGD